MMRSCSWYCVIFVWGSALFSVEAATSANQDLECPACAFDGLDNLDDCVLYGQPESGDVLIPWKLASPDCLQAYHDEMDHEFSYNHNVIARIWPYGYVEAVPSAQGVQVFLEWLQSGESSSTTPVEQETIRHVQLQFLSHFFVTSQPGRGVQAPVTFPDRLTLGDTGETTYDCLAENQFADCWTALREYLRNPNIRLPNDQSSNGVETLQTIGQVLMEWRRRDLERQQQSIRMHVCRNDQTAPEACGTVLDQVQTVLQGNPSLTCAAIGHGLWQGGGYHTQLAPSGTATCHLTNDGGQYGSLERNRHDVVAAYERSHHSSATRAWFSVAWLPLFGTLFLVLWWI